MGEERVDRMSYPWKDGTSILYREPGVQARPDANSRLFRDAGPCYLPQQESLMRALLLLSLLLSACPDSKDTDMDSGFWDGDGDDYSFNEGDCDDNDPAVFPGAEEVRDGIDNDCDDLADEDVTGASTWYLDRDADGFGDPALFTTACTQPSLYVAEATDCDYLDATAWPGASEVCDGADNDCDGAADEDATGASTWYADLDASQAFHTVAMPPVPRFWSKR